MLTNLDLSYTDIGTKGARKIGQALQVNLVLTTIDLNGSRDALAWEIERLLVINRALDTKLLAVMMSTHARLGADSGLEVIDDHLVTLICDLFCRASKTSSLFGKPGVFSRPVLSQMKRHCRRRLALCASRNCRSGRTCFLAGRVIGMAAATVMLR